MVMTVKQTLSKDQQSDKANALPLLQCQNLSWQVGQQCILQHINFSIPNGSFTGLIGPNGAGKSSLLRCLYRYLKADSGAVLFQTKDIWQMSANEYAKNVAVVLQEPPSQFNLSVHDVVALGLVPHQSLFAARSKGDEQKIVAAIAKVGLAHKTKQAFEHLSGGEKQRALIARAIVQSPQLLLMDEPTSHLDIKYQIQLIEMAKALGITVIASFHDLNLASAICDNILVMNTGKLVAQGAPHEVVTENMLADVFGVCSKVSMHPQQQCPHITYYYQYNLPQENSDEMKPVIDNDTPLNGVKNAPV